MNRQEEKKLLRQKLRAQRNQLSAEARKYKDDLIFKNLIRESVVTEADLLLLYASCKGEPDTWQLIKWAWKQGKPVALPRCGEAGQMQFFVVSREEDLHTGAYAIPEPVTEQQAVMTKQTVCIVPALSFTRTGIRLGQGGGYYDRFLKKYPDLYTIGICYDMMIQAALPYEVHDCQVKNVITDIMEDKHEI